MSASTRAEREQWFPTGPVQMLVLGFDDDARFAATILPELERLRELEVVRLVDLLVVQKDEAGELDVYRTNALAQDEAAASDSLAAALVGLCSATEDMSYEAVAGVLDEEAVWYLSDTIPAGSRAAVALIEHRWAIPLRNGVAEAGGFALADEWIHPADLVAVGAAALEVTT